MICRDCLIWQNKIKDLVRMFEPVPSLCVKYGMSNEQMACEFRGLWERRGVAEDKTLMALRARQCVGLLR